MTRHPVVSVVVPTRNRLEYLKETVDSVLAQSSTDWELIIVDDASTDGTGAWIETLDHPRIHSISSPEHSERCVARNAGFEKATGRYVLFLDDDDLLAPGSLHSLAHSLEKNESAVVAVGGAAEFDGNGHRKRLSHPRFGMTKSPWVELLLAWEASPSQTLVVAEALRETGGWNEEIVTAEDGELWLKLSRLGPFVFHPHVVVERRMHEGQWRDERWLETRQMVHRSFIETLSLKDRKLAERVLEARRLKEQGDTRYFYGYFREALGLYMQAARAFPPVLWLRLTFPFTTRRWIKAAGGALLGRRIFLRLRALKGRVRKLLGRELDEGSRHTPNTPNVGA